MNMELRWFTVRRLLSAGRRAGWALAILVLVVAPALDLAWNEPALDGSQGTRCQLHGNPGADLQLVSPVVALAAELRPPSEPLARFPLIASSIFIPPRG